MESQLSNNDNQQYLDCLNCHQELPEGALFCANCGQKKTDGKISIKEFLFNFFDNVFNLDSRIFKTLSLLFIPGKLTIEYFKGKHKSYYHPIRLYLVMSLIFFAILSFMESSLVKFDIGSLTKDMIADAQKEIHFLEFKTILDSVNQTIIAEEGVSIQIALDTLMGRLPEAKERDSIDLNIFFAEDINVNLNSSIKIDKLDIFTRSPDELLEHYKIKDFYQKVSIKQSVRFMRDQGLFARQIASNLPLMLLLMMPVLALFLKLLYIRRNRFYIEHLVLNFHHHSFAFMLGSLLVLFPEEQLPTVMSFGALVVLLFLFLSMKYYYQQGYRKTFIKFMLFNFCYLFLFLIAIAITFIISFLLF